MDQRNHCSATISALFSGLVHTVHPNLNLPQFPRYIPSQGCGGWVPRSARFLYPYFDYIFLLRIRNHMDHMDQGLLKLPINAAAQR
jgi:hypothetical protein